MIGVPAGIRSEASLFDDGFGPSDRISEASFKGIWLRFPHPPGSWTITWETPYLLNG